MNGRDGNGDESIVSDDSHDSDLVVPVEKQTFTIPAIASDGTAD